MNAFTIKDLETLSGIKAHTIRIWEQRYNFLKPQRTTTNIRYYTNEELKTVLNIALLNKYGVKISHIDRMHPGEISNQVLLLDDVNAVQERIINELVEEMVELDMGKFEQIISNHIAAKGIENTVIRILFPFLEKIGILWQTGHINAAQEHLVTNIIRRKLLVAIDKTVIPKTLDKTFLLFLPEGEHHELGLLFVYYLLKTRGACIIYLGANIPMKDVEEVVNCKKPDIAFIHLTGTCPNFNFERFLSSVHRNFGATQIIISGRLTQECRRKPSGRVEFKRSLAEVMEWISLL